MKNLFSVRTIILTGSLLLQLSTLCFHSHAAAGDVDFSFDPGSGVDGPVNAVAVQPDGKVIIGGTFTTVRGFARFKLARLNADGSEDSGFNPGTVIWGAVYAVTLQPDGKVLAGHDGGILRLNSDGTPDSSFDSTYSGTGANGAVMSIALQPDGKVLIGGWFNTVNGTNRNHIARLNANGSLDGDFNPGTGADNIVFSVALQSDGRVLIAGWFNNVNGTNRSYIARLNGNGSLDSSFNSGIGVDRPVSHVGVQPDGKLLIWGGGFSVNGTNRNGLARLNADGSLDNSFNPGLGVDGAVNSVAVQSDGKVLIGGSFLTVNGTNRNSIARLNDDGSLDPSFNPSTGATGDGYQGVTSLAVRPDGKVFIGGDFTVVNGTNRNRIARLNADGGLDSSFNPGTGVNNSVAALAVQPDSKVLIGGTFTTVKNLDRNGIARLNADGSGDSDFDPATSGIPIALQPDGKVVLGGAMARLNANGSPESSFHPDLLFGVTTSPYDSDGASAIALQSDGKMLVGGASTHFYDCDPFGGGCSVYTIYFVTRLNPNGSRDTNFAGAGAVGRVSSIAVQSDGKVVIGSDAFTAVKIVRLNSDGSLDSGFNPGIGPAGSVSSVASQPDGKVLIGGYFTTVNGVNRTNIARLNSDGSLDSSFNPGTEADGTVRSIALQPDGKVLIGGDFTTVNGTSRNHIARLNADGGLDNSFNPGTGADGIVRSIALQPDGNVLIGGDFTTVKGVVRPRVARLYGDAAPPALRIVRSNEFVIVAWPVTLWNFQLQETSDLGLPNSWSPVAQAAVTNAGQISIIVSTEAGGRFFRLKQP